MNKMGEKHRKEWGKHRRRFYKPAFPLFMPLRVFFGYSDQKARTKLANLTYLQIYDIFC